MTVSGFDRYLKDVLESATEEARRQGAATVEAEHLLLAIAAAGSPALDAAGLDQAAIRAALDREFAHSLATVGVSAAAFDLPPATPAKDRRLQPGASVRLALERTFVAAAGRDPQPAHLLLGILAAEVGIVPRALALAGFDRVALIARVHG
ncbi:Clp protease N-terminal domain-containing protein [Paractinoplanes durhamensis]|uniref:Clp R domain-containing protein n=1 Tax=Paractinoplanes durhamensis TaxID=113563 RepID=A0ABQ3YSU3_9ACTN|nr:Clp protease N-terminal domain-containing protein [Actinoplanes durhamensis]GIE00671.1 hypothetical protein Adu01nite_20210 [Actinoplanes durhamensis]